MKKELIKLANHLDKLGHLDLADELDRIVKSAQDSGLEYSEVTFEDRNPTSTQPPNEDILSSLATKTVVPQDWATAGTKMLEKASFKESLSDVNEWIVNYMALAQIFKVMHTTGVLNIGGVPGAYGSFNVLYGNPNFVGLPSPLNKTKTTPLEVIRFLIGKYPEVGVTEDEVVEFVKAHMDDTPSTPKATPPPPDKSAPPSSAKSTPPPSASAPPTTKPAQPTTSTSCSLNHSSGTKLSDSWGTYLIVSPSEVMATSKESSKSVKLTPAYSGWCKVVGNLNKLKPSTTTPSAPATKAPTETSAPAAKAPAPFELEKAMQEAGIDQKVAGKFMRMLTRGVLGELSVFNPKTVSGQKEKVKQLIISKSRGQADGITDAEAQQIVDALASSTAAKLTAKSSNEFIIGQLAKIATELDQAELYAEADILDEIIRNL